MSNFTKAQLPADVQDPIQLKMYLLQLIEDIDTAFGYRDDTPFITQEPVEGVSISQIAARASLRL